MTHYNDWSRFIETSDYDGRKRERERGCLSDCSVNKGK